MTPQLKRLIRKKQRFYNKAKRSKQLSDQAEFKSIQGQVCQSIHAEHQKHFTKILSSSSSLNDNKPFWHYIQSCIKDRIGISSLQTTDGIATTLAEKAEVLIITISNQCLQPKTQVHYQHYQYQLIHPNPKLVLLSTEFSLYFLKQILTKPVGLIIFQPGSWKTLHKNYLQ